VFARGILVDPGLKGCINPYDIESDQNWAYCKDQPLDQAEANSIFVVWLLAGSLVVLWLVSLIVVSVFIARHRRAGGHCKWGSEPPEERARNSLENALDWP
jgi:hypothetical protein